MAESSEDREPWQEEAAARLEEMHRERTRMTNKIHAQCLLSRCERARARRSGETVRVLVWAKGRE